MSDSEILKIHESPLLDRATLVLAFTGWMDGGDVSTGTVQCLAHLLPAKPIADIDPEPFYIYNVPGSMEVAGVFRPHVEIEDGLVKRSTCPPTRSIAIRRPAWCCSSARSRTCDGGPSESAFSGWRTNWASAASCSSGRLAAPCRTPACPACTCPAPMPSLLAEMAEYGVRRSDYQGPGSFTSYLMAQAKSVGLDMISLVAEIPGYLQGANPASIEAVARRLAKLLHLHLDLAPLRTCSTAWELQVSQIVEQNEEAGGDDSQAGGSLRQRIAQRRTPSRCSVVLA